MRKTGLIICLTLIILAFSATFVIASPDIYVVQSGDCLWDISVSNGVSVDVIRQLNGLSSDELSVGQKLTLRAYSAPEEVQASTENSSGDTTEYTVCYGDSLWSIASKYGTTVQQIRALNGLSDDLLHVGDVLRIEGTVAYTPVSRAGSSVNGSRLVEIASQYLGTPYRYGGSGPGGFDCSGFAKYVFSQIDINLPRTAASMYGYGVEVAKADLIPGDLLFFACTGGGIDHVGIYSGGGSFIHSSSPRSGGVIYSSLYSGYYAGNYVGAKRVIR